MRRRNRTLVKDGQSYSMYQSCWAYRDTYVTQSADKGTCQTYTDNPACTLVSHQCAFYSEEGACLHEYATYSCESKTSGKVMVCGGDVFCLDGECDKAQSGQSNDFAEAVSQLAALAAAGKDVAALNGGDVRAFTGQAKFCKKAAAGYSNCCKDSGWGQDIGLAKCSSDEKALAKAKSNKLTVSVGEFCSKKVLGVCLEKKRSYCQFDSKLAQIRNQLAADQAQQRQAIAKLAEHYGIMFFYRGQDPIDGQLAQVINGFRDTYGLSVIPVSVDGVINPLLPDSPLCHCSVSSIRRYAA